ncbi:hypothetical protein O7A05_27870 [Mesorhizobium sp. Cs1330R2N1]|uniref:Uncharacterized protein n=1 Tax=Mesorhizobium argentiipisi TaxID=3015175 RepID=A0ABU8KJR2_9HYPH
MPQDFRSRVALYLLGAGIPAGDEAICIKGVDRVVGDSVDEEFEAAAVGKVLRVGCGQWHCRTRITLASGSSSGDTSAT